MSRSSFGGNYIKFDKNSNNYPPKYLNLLYKLCSQIIKQIKNVIIPVNQSHDWSQIFCLQYCLLISIISKISQNIKRPLQFVLIDRRIIQQKSEFITLFEAANRIQNIQIKDGTHKSQSLKIQQLNQTMQQLSYLSPQQDQPQQTPEQNFPSQSFYPYKNQSTTNSSQYHQKKQQSDSNYTTSINQLIAQPIEENYYSMEYVYQSIYQLSDYLWNKKIKAHYLKDNQQNISRNAYNSMSFDDYLLPLQEELNKYDKFKKSKNKQEQDIYTILAAQSKHNNLTSLNSPNNNPNTLAPTPNSLNSKNKISPFKPQPLINIPSLQSQLNKCYQQVPFIYFQQSFSLDFSNFQDKQNRLKYNNTQKMKEQQEDMNDNLDLIQINLFGQIHRKFEDYFRAAANFDYLKESISLQLIKLKQARSRVSRVQIQFIIKSQKLRKKIIQRNNYQKLLKKMKILKSLKKLPSIIQTILQSSLPYQCLQLLKTTKKSISQVQQIKCVQSILTNIKTSETIVQLGLNKRYTDELYLYIEETFRVINFQELFKKAALDCPVTDKDNMNNSSTLNNISRRSQNLADANGDTSFRAGDRSGFFVLEQLGEGKGTSTFNGKLLLKNFYAKRQQGKQYQIAMILLQSYEYVDFPVDVTKIKISNGLRVICRKFQKDLISHIKKQLQKSALIQQKSILNDSIDQQNPKIKISSVNNAKSPLQKDQDDSAQKISQYINKVSIQFYIKHIRVLNELFKQSINRYLGYVLTLVTQYEEKLYKQILQIEKVSINKKSSTKSIEQLSQKSIAISDSESHLEQLTLSKVKSLQKSQKMSKMQTSHNKFKQILSEELSVLPSIFKIIEQKIKHFLTMKNISNSTPHQFFQWISLVRFWQRWFDVLIQESVLINYNCTYLHSNTEISSSTQLLTLGQDMIQELINVVLDNVKKSMGTMNLKNLITDLTINYLNAYASNINSQLYQTVLDQSWQSVQIPQQFSEVLNGIISRPNQNQNMSITILDASTNKLSSSFASSNNKSSLQPQQSINSTASQFKYKILKNNILIEGQRYKLTISFLLLSQFIEELIRVGRLFQGITGQNDEESLRQSKYIRKILAHLYDKIYELIDYYNAATKEMILEKKALKMEKIKGNNITVKHICLLSNCLTFLQKITKQIPLKDLNIIINKKQRQAQTIYSLTNHNILLIDKISSILHKKMQQTVSNVKSKQQQKNFNTTAFYQFVCQSNQSIVTLFLQITQIIDEYLDVQKCQKILKLPFQLFVQKYFKMVILKGDKFLQEASILLEKMKFLKKYFKNQFISMQREIQQ